MILGADISAEQVKHAWVIYQSAGLFKEGIIQFGRALTCYENGKPYEFDSVVLFEMMK